MGVPEARPGFCGHAVDQPERETRDDDLPR